MNICNYVCMYVTQVSREIKEAIKKAGIIWEEVDYREAARYVVLNWDKEKCNKSSLRRILPRRRGKTGVRPGIKGAGPRGKESGDQEQWIFKKGMKLTEEEKDQTEMVVTLTLEEDDKTELVVTLTLEEEDQIKMEMILTLAEEEIIVSQTEEDLAEMTMKTASQTGDVKEGEVEILQDLRL